METCTMALHQQVRSIRNAVWDVAIGFPRLNSYVGCCCCCCR